ncbi:MAG: biopolymer transporter ExbD [Verrucomicrobia bacterium]|nr:biopolymer transporter ExbD [Verrucomicrobiota bacterium]
MKFRNRRGVTDVGFQIAPMIDIMLFLLCFFVTIQVYSQWETEIEIKLPTAESGGLPQRLPGEIIVNIRADGTLVVNSQVLVQAELQTLLNRMVQLFPGQPVLVRADQTTPYAHVIGVLDVCRQADLWNVSFATLPAESSATGVR